MFNARLCYSSRGGRFIPKRSAVFDRDFDLIVIGGGIMGACVVRDASARGMRAVLFEQDDLAAGTSSRTSKLVHGGLRYLEQGAFGLVAESARERAIWLRAAPHLVRPLPFLFPIYRGARPAWMVRLGMTLYDALAWFRNVESHRMLSADEALALEPALRRDGLLGAARFYDAQMDDARLCLEVALTARSDGATLETRARVDGLVRQGDRIAGVRLGAREVRGRVVVNASGPWLDRVCDMAAGPARPIRKTRGSHLIVPGMLKGHALALSAHHDGRTFFALPWRGMTLIGTTDLDYEGDPAAVTCTEEERTYLLDETRRMFPAAGIGPDTVIAEFAGVRPLVYAEGVSASQVGRGDLILESADGLISIAGGKFTTARAVARRVVDRVAARLTPADFPSSRTARTPLLGGRPVSREEDTAWSARAKALGLDDAQTTALRETYGARFGALLDLAAERGPGGRLHAGLPWIGVQVDFAVERELARTLEDVLRRRLPVALGPYRRDPALCDAVADRMARLLGWTADDRREYVRRYLGGVTP